MRKALILTVFVFMLFGCSEEDESGQKADATRSETKAGSAEVGETIAEPDASLEPISSPTAAGGAVIQIETPVEATATPEPTPDPPTATPEPTSTPLPPFPGEPLAKDSGDLFSGSGTCTLCHTNLTDESGADVSIDRYWRSTMMANAARDPYWQASVRAEVLELPQYQDVIEDTCATCHLPMGRTTLAADGAGGALFDEGMLDENHELHGLGMDGVSCTLCHQVEDVNLGDPGSFSGGYLVDTDLPAGERVNYGPYPVSEEDAEEMRSAVGFIPVESEHIEQSELCAACHTLYTPTIDKSGEIVGQFPEQMPFIEWLYSDFRGLESCQECHMPVADGAVVISAKSETPRSPFHQHDFVGGNAYMLRVLRTFGEEMGITASSEQIEDTILRVESQLQRDTATLEILEAAIEDEQLNLRLVISSDVGHKFPTGFPSRRSWLHVTVTGAGGGILFESGGWNGDGSIIGNDNDDDPTFYEPHYRTITSPDEVQIYEVQLRDTAGAVTTALLRGNGYSKDNRLLPRGFAKSTVPDDIAVHGLAAEDPDFDGGGDTIVYEIDLGDGVGPFAVTVELLYQSIGYRWAKNLEEADHEGEGLEIDTFVDYYEVVPNEPVIVSSTTQELSP